MNCRYYRHEHMTIRLWRRASTCQLCVGQYAVGGLRCSLSEATRHSPDDQCAAESVHTRRLQGRMSTSEDNVVCNWCLPTSSFNDHQALLYYSVTPKRTSRECAGGSLQLGRLSAWLTNATCTCVFSAYPTTKSTP